MKIVALLIAFCSLTLATFIEHRSRSEFMQGIAGALFALGLLSLFLALLLVV